MSNSKWTNEEENLLTEMVESYLQKKKTKKEAFDVVANILNRSSSACKARYLKIEKLYSKSNDIKNITQHLNLSPTITSLEDIISYLKKFQRLERYEEKNNKLRYFLKSLEKENIDLMSRYYLALKKIHNFRELFLKTISLTNKLDEK